MNQKILKLIQERESARGPFDPERAFLGIISLGCATQNMWLMAEALGIGFHIVSSFGGSPVEKEVKQILGIPEPLKIVYAIRLGYPAAASNKNLRVRRDEKDLTHHNHYGIKGLE